MNNKFVPKDHQEAFDAAAKHLLKVGEPSVNTKNCCYSGTGCAMRPFFGDDQETLENLDDLGALSDMHPDSMPEFVSEDLDFYQALQTAHDMPAFNGKRGDEWLTDWKDRMLDISTEYKLSSSIFEVTA